MSLRLSSLAAGLALVFGVAAAHGETIKIGVTPGPHAQVLEVVKPIAAKKGLDIQITEFSDYVIPNTALDAGELQANSFQHQPFLDNQVKDRGFKIESVGATLNFPLGDTRANGVVSRIDPATGKVSLVYVAGGSASTHLVLDVTGYYH